jgi:hypothetical protein
MPLSFYGKRAGQCREAADRIGQDPEIPELS